LLGFDGRCLQQRLALHKISKRNGRGKYDSYFDDALGNFVTLRIANYIDAWWHDIMSCNIISVHDMA
jgi:hypothetical protein